MTDDIFKLTPEQFAAVALVVQRAAILLSRVHANEPTGPDTAETVALAATAAAYNVTEMLEHVAGPDRESFAVDMGWPSADALEKFLFDGASFGVRH